MSTGSQNSIWRMLRRMLEALTLCVIVAISFWNIWIFQARVVTLPPAASDELVIQEERYKPIRVLLNDAGYRRGTIAFITNRGLRAGEESPDDDRRWGQGQYLMVPWTLLRNGRSVSGVTLPDEVSPYIIGDFWEGKPAEIPEEFVELYDSGSGLFLFRRKSAP